jgi:hypothetical protein
MLKHGRIGEHKAWELALWERVPGSGFYIDLQWRRKGRDHPGVGFCLQIGNRLVIEISLYDVRHADEIARSAS